MPEASPEPVPATMPVAEKTSIAQRVRRAAGRFWLDFLFWNARRRPWFVALSKPIFLFFAWRFSPVLRDGTLANARRLLGRDASRSDVTALAKSIIASFLQFVYDIGRCGRMSRAAIKSEIESVEGVEAYNDARSKRVGVIVVTAHLGCFEVGIVGLLDREPNVHVVFSRDRMHRFERLRSEHHRRLGVIEARVDDGLATWIGLRDALAADHAVLIQGDRVMPGHQGVRMPFLDGHLLVPAGPVKLALATGAPIVPTFALRTPSGKVRIMMEPAIEVTADGRSIGVEHPGMIALTEVIERYVRAHPEQWLVLHRAWCEDQ
ncbi:MAG: hypothetical protein CMJ18_26720 [Phycisphaeraceae bacterium]|nr:hypothetical protein [Phycisphaeraceae bacterium]